MQNTASVKQGFLQVPASSDSSLCTWQFYQLLSIAGLAIVLRPTLLSIWTVKSWCKNKVETVAKSCAAVQLLLDILLSRKLKRLSCNQYQSLKTKIDVLVRATFIGHLTQHLSFTYTWNTDKSFVVVSLNLGRELHWFLHIWPWRRPTVLKELLDTTSRQKCPKNVPIEQHCFKVF